jgi:hypothetical protein
MQTALIGGRRIKAAGHRRLRPVSSIALLACVSRAACSLKHLDVVAATHHAQLDTKRFAPE